MSDTEIHTPTLDACIEALSHKMVHKTYREPFSNNVEDYYHFADNNNPLDILEALRPAPEISEAEKLASEWATGMGYDFVTPGNVSLVEFVMERLRVPAELVEPDYMFGPWLKHDGSNKSPIPGDWMVETVFDNESFADHEDEMISTEEWDGLWHRITDYRVRFEIGKWYDWTGGACPLPDDCRFEFRMRSGLQGTYTRGSDGLNLRCKHTGWSGDIVAFKIIAN